LKSAKERDWSNQKRMMKADSKARKIKPVRHAPTRADLLTAADSTVPDLIGYDLQILFCGINPGLYSAYTRHHLARPGNRFWPALFASGFTERLLAPNEEHELLRCGYGITNLVERATLAAGELNRAELVAGAARFRKKVAKYRPRTVAILGVSAYRAAFDSPDATVGPQADKIGNSVVWVLPNPSGLNAHFTPKALAKLFREFRLQCRALT
jgi:TDG/mug DNA glycosylase family protein